MPAIVGPATEPITLLPRGAHAFAVVGACRRPRRGRESIAGLWRRSGVPPAELAATALVSRESGSGTRGFFEQALRAQAGLEHVPPLAELSSTTTAIKAAVAAGAGPAVLSSLAVAAELSPGTLRAVTITGLNLNRTLPAVWAPGTR